MYKGNKGFYIPPILVSSETQGSLNWSGNHQNKVPSTIHDHSHDAPYHIRKYHLLGLLRTLWAESTTSKPFSSPLAQEGPSRLDFQGKTLSLNVVQRYGDRGRPRKVSVRHPDPARQARVLPSRLALCWVSDILIPEHVCVQIHLCVCVFVCTCAWAYSNQYLSLTLDTSKGLLINPSPANTHLLWKSHSP